MSKKTEFEEKRKFTLPALRAVPNAPGIYAFWKNGVGRCVYVGKSDNIQDRLYQYWNYDSHKDELHELLTSDSVKIEFSYFTADQADIKKLEAFYINKLKPSLNKTSPKL